MFSRKNIVNFRLRNWSKLEFLQTILFNLKILHFRPKLNNKMLEWIRLKNILLKCKVTYGRIKLGAVQWLYINKPCKNFCRLIPQFIRRFWIDLDHCATATTTSTAVSTTAAATTTTAIFSTAAAATTTTTTATAQFYKFGPTTIITRRTEQQWTRKVSHEIACISCCVYFIHFEKVGNRD